MTKEKEMFDFKKFVAGPLDIKNYAKVIVFGICACIIGVIVFGLVSAIQNIFPKKKQATSSTRAVVNEGGIANITNINNPISDLKQGVYGRVSSLRLGVGVFKEVTPNIDISLGGSKKWDRDEYEVDTEVRFKF